MNAQVKGDHGKPRLNIGTLGHEGHGKTMLAAAITRFLEKLGGATFQPYELLHQAPQVRERGVASSMTRVEYQTSNRHYTHFDCPEHLDHVKNLLTGAARLDGAILVVSAADGLTAQTEAHVLLACQLGVPSLVVFLNKMDLVDDSGGREVLEKSVRALLERHGFAGHSTSIVRGSALQALAGEASPWGEPAIAALLAAVERDIPPPPDAVDAPFLLPVDEAFPIDDRSTAVVGRVIRGAIRVGDALEVVGQHLTKKTEVVKLEMFRKQVGEVRAGDSVGVWVRDLRREDLSAGQVLAKPGSITAHKRFTARIYVLTQQEEGRQAPFFEGHRPRFTFRATDVTGTVTLPAGVERVDPGDSTLVEVELSASIAMEKGLRFTMCEEGLLVGVGFVVEVAE